MKFDPEILGRAMNGDSTALDELIIFDEGPAKPLRDCNSTDLEVMQAWMRYQSLEAKRMYELVHAELERRQAVDRPRLQVVPE